MYFTGAAYRTIPRTSSLSFEFDNLFCNGDAVIGFSGATGSPNFSISISSGKIYDNNGEYIFGSPEAISIYGNIASGRSQLFINGEPLRIQSAPNGNFDAFFVSPQGQSLNADVFIRVPQIPITVDFPSQFIVASGIPVTIQNQSSLDFSIFDYQIVFQDNNGVVGDVFSGVISGTISGNGSGVFLLSDVSNFPAGRNLEFNLYLETSFGQFVGTYTTESVSGFTSNVYSINKLGPDISLGILFFGDTGLNSFSFDSVPSSGFVAVQASKYSQTLQNYSSGNLRFSFQPYYPLDNTPYLAEYVTGIEITASGIYDECPQASFREYFSIHDIFINSKSVFSTNCTGVIGLGFSGAGGSGATGRLFLNPINIADTVVYGTISNPAYYLALTGYSIDNAGSGYTGSPEIYLDFSNAGVGCIDYASGNGNVYPYSEFSGRPLMTRQAGYMTGVIVCEANVSGYSVSGIILTNPGSGYSSVFPPAVLFTRTTGDTQSGDATGVIKLNSQSGIYDFNGLWSMRSGLSSTTLSDVAVDISLFNSESGNNWFISEDGIYSFRVEWKDYSGVIPYASNSQIYFGISLNPSDYTGVMIARLSLINEDGSSQNFLITGQKTYSSNPYLLINDVNYFIQSNPSLEFLNGGIS